MFLRSTDLPVPEGPKMAVVRPFGMSKLTSSSTVWLPKHLVSPRTEMIGSPGATQRTGAASSPPCAGLRAVAAGAVPAPCLPPHSLIATIHGTGDQHAPHGRVGLLPRRTCTYPDRKAAPPAPFLPPGGHGRPPRPATAPRRGSRVGGARCKVRSQGRGEEPPARCTRTRLPSSRGLRSCRRGPT